MRRARAQTLSSVEWYRERIRELVEEVSAGPDYERFGNDMRAATAHYRTRLDLLNALSRAALADKGLEDLASIQRRLREAESTVADMMRASADERHHRAARVEAGRADGDGVSGAPLH